MRAFLREHYYTIAFLVLWILLARVAGASLYAALPLGVILLRRIDQWQDIFFGFIMCLVLSDMQHSMPGMDAMKTAKYGYILVLSFLLLVDRRSMQPFAHLFVIFLPFFLYAFVPIVRSPTPIVAVEKTISYALLFLVVPNYVLRNFRLYGWDFFKNLIWFLVFVLAAQKLLPYLPLAGDYYLAGRFRGWFGNHNGMALFTSLSYILFGVVNNLRPGLFSRLDKLFIHAVFIYFLITCGARTSLMATLMFFLFIQFFRISVFLGIIAFIAFIGVAELISSNLPLIINTLGLEDYLRVDTIQDASGRFIAWNYAWEKINSQGHFLIGAGFANDEWVMKQGRDMLSMMGHQGGVHSTYLSFWLNVGIIGLIIFFRSFILIFVKASKNTPVAFAVMFSVLFSIIYESWLVASLNPYTILLLVVLTVMSEEEIIGSLSGRPLEMEADTVAEGPRLILPAR